eukprot:668804-Prymnesium_polylepis.1
MMRFRLGERKRVMTAMRSLTLMASRSSSKLSSQSTASRRLGAGCSAESSLMTDVMGLKRLDDSDGCIFVNSDPNSSEIFAIGVYVDNLQIVHSAKLDADGEAVDKHSFYAKFIDKLRADWDV